MNRRRLLGLLGVGAAVVATGTAPVVLVAKALEPPKPPPMRLLCSGDVITAEYFGELVDRVNKLSAQ